jgi:LuxR family transcriptional regulator, maltose regulon positive regulatory protein
LPEHPRKPILLPLWKGLTGMTPSLAALLEEGNRALEQGAWEEARERFEAANALKETGEAHEGLSWAEWWANNGDNTIRLREKAYRLYRQTGDDVGAARAAMWLATDYEDFRGEFSIGRGWRQRAHSLLAECPLSPEHGWLGILEGDAALLIEEDTTKARRCAAEAVMVARQCGVADMESVARAMEGLALVGEGRIDEGMKRLDEIAAATGRPAPVCSPAAGRERPEHAEHPTTSAEWIMCRRSASRLASAPSTRITTPSTAR